jgi:hypothetical protein
LGLGWLMNLPNSHAGFRTFSFEELTVWRTELPDVKFAVLPPSNTRPNPLIADDKLFVSVLSPPIRGTDFLSRKI